MNFPCRPVLEILVADQHGEVVIACCAQEFFGNIEVRDERVKFRFFHFDNAGADIRSEKVFENFPLLVVILHDRYGLARFSFTAETLVHIGDRAIHRVRHPKRLPGLLLPDRRPLLFDLVQLFHRVDRHRAKCRCFHLQADADGIRFFQNGIFETDPSHFIPACRNEKGIGFQTRDGEIASGRAGLAGAGSFIQDDGRWSGKTVVAIIHSTAHSNSRGLCGKDRSRKTRDDQQKKSRAFHIYKGTDFRPTFTCVF